MSRYKISHSVSFRGRSYEDSYFLSFERRLSSTILRVQTLVSMGRPKLIKTNIKSSGDMQVFNREKAPASDGQ